MNWKVLVSRIIPESGIESLKHAGFDVDVYTEDRPIPRKELIRKIPAYDALLAVLTEKVDRELLDVAGNLKIVANYAVGYNNIDVEACSQNHVAVTNTPGVLTESTADLTFTLILAVAKRIVEGDRLTRSGHFKGWSPLLLLGSDITGKTLGIIGAGRIGTAVAARAAGFDMPVLYHDTKNNEILDTRYKARLVSMDELLSHSDFISIHVPLTGKTNHMISTEEFAKMKPQAYLINTARGPIVDENALVQALRNKQIAGAALDVFENEPRLADGLAQFSNTVLVPHIGSATVETRTKMALMAAENIIKMSQGKMPPNILNREIFHSSDKTR